MSAKKSGNSVKKLNLDEGQLAKLPKALKDVFGRAPKSVTIELQKPKGRVSDDDGGWSGNVYKYNF